MIYQVSNFNFSYKLVYCMGELFRASPSPLILFVQGAVHRLHKFLLLLMIPDLRNQLDEFFLSIFGIHVGIDVLHFLSQQESLPLLSLCNLEVLQKHPNVLLIDLVINTVLRAEPISDHNGHPMDVRICLLQQLYDRWLDHLKGKGVVLLEVGFVDSDEDLHWQNLFQVDTALHLLHLVHDDQRFFLDHLLELFIIAEHVLNEFYKTLEVLTTAVNSLYQFHTHFHILLYQLDFRKVFDSLGLFLLK